MMEFIDIDQFFSYLQPDLMECPEPVMANHVRSAAIELCEHAAVWQHVCDPMTMIPGQREYELERPSKESLVHSVLGAWLGTRGLDPATHADLALARGKLATNNVTGVYAYDVSERGFVTLFGTPLGTHPEKLMFTVSLKPTRDADAIPLQLYNDYHDTIIEGALSRAMRMVKRPWTDVALADNYGAKFFRAKVRARMAIDRGNVTGPQRARHRQFVSNHRYY